MWAGTPASSVAVRETSARACSPLGWLTLFPGVPRAVRCHRRAAAGAWPALVRLQAPRTGPGSNCSVSCDDAGTPCRGPKPLPCPTSELVHLETVLPARELQRAGFHGSREGPVPGVFPKPPCSAFERVRAVHTFRKRSSAAPQNHCGRHDAVSPGASLNCGFLQHRCPAVCVLFYPALFT